MIASGHARYDGLAEWYDRAMLDPLERAPLAASAYDLLARLLGPGSGQILDVGCGTGLAAERVRDLGYIPLGVDISVDQLRVAQDRLPVIQGDAAQLPLPSGRMPAAYSTFVSSDLDDFEGSVSEIHRVLAPGGRYVSVCLHPCFNGGYSELRPDGTVLVSPGYAASVYQSRDEFETTIRSRVGAWHRPLAEVINTFLTAGFHLDRLEEGGPARLPSLLGISLHKP